jgi:hypothetical protein
MSSLKLRQNSLSAGNRNLPTRLLLSVRNLAMINDQSISSGTLTHGPVQLLGERSTWVREEELYTKRSALDP